jgi:hypothetical protein
MCVRKVLDILGSARTVDFFLNSCIYFSTLVYGYDSRRFAHRRKSIRMSIDIHHIGVLLFSLASVLSLLFVIAKPLGKEFEAVGLVWIRALKRLTAEWKSPAEQPNLSDSPTKESDSLTKELH